MTGDLEAEDAVMVQAKHLLGGVKECLEICQAG
jgi:hypothetical protein